MKKLLKQEPLIVAYLGWFLSEVRNYQREKSKWTLISVIGIAICLIFAIFEPTLDSEGEE